jgi:hypothetical protein
MRKRRDRQRACVLNESQHHSKSMELMYYKIATRQTKLGCRLHVRQNTILRKIPQRSLRRGDFKWMQSPAAAPL